MSDTVTQMLDRVSELEWDDKVRLFHGLCDYLGQRATLEHTAGRFSHDASTIRRELEGLHWDEAWASFEASHLARLFARFDVDCVFDVGANSGQYADRLRSKVGFHGVIVSFEPVPALASRLREKAERDPQWLIEECALDRTEWHRDLQRDGIV